DHDHDHDHHHDVNRHGADIHAFCITVDAPAPRAVVTEALKVLVAYQGPELLRVKGVICIAEEPERPLIVHGTQHVFHEPLSLDAWPDEDHRTKLVFITQGIEREPVDAFLRAWWGGNAPA
ncbi:MAG: GTP-binding protein, partial [Pseudomonadota bacterium]